MKTLWAPWRMTFIAQAKKKQRQNSAKSCIFCQIQKVSPRFQNLILFVGDLAFVVLNKYPYTNGHVMIIPKRHIQDYTELTSEEHREMGELKALSIRALKKALRAQGFNIGMNLGEAAGAGIKGHLHEHIVPRWVGDHNFMPVFGDVRVVPEHLKATYHKLKKAF